MNRYRIESLIRLFWGQPSQRKAILEELRANGQSRLADQLYRKLKALEAQTQRKAPAKKKKKKGILSMLGGLLGIEEDSFQRNSVNNIKRIKTVMIQALADLKNPNLTESARVLALKNYEESRSVLEDTAKNFPDESIRELAMKSAIEVLQSKDAQDYLQKEKLQQSIGLSGPKNYYLSGYGKPSWM